MRTDPVPLSEIASDLVPYESARSLLKGEGWVFLDANENPFPPCLEKIELENLNRYPDPSGDQLRQAIAEFYRVGPENVLLGNGTDELIDLSFRTFVRAGRAVLAPSPSYGMYRVAADLNGLSYCTVPLDSDLQPDVEKLSARFAECDLLCLCTPNNPTGVAVKRDRLQVLMETFSGLMLVDEAYGEFSDARGLSSALEWVRLGASNIMVIRTFSKAFGAAGLRLGYAIAAPSVIEPLSRMKPPYNVNLLAQRIGLRLWENRALMELNVVELLREQERVAEQCARLGLGVVSSAANFLLLRVPEGKCSQILHQKLRDEFGIVVRRFSGDNLENSLRVSVGTPRENALFLDALGRLLA